MSMEQRNEPTTAEIVKETRLCSQPDWNCDKCSRNGMPFGDCFTELYLQAADRLESQERLIEQLKKANQFGGEMIDKQEREIERLKTEIQSDVGEMARLRTLNETLTARAEKAEAREKAIIESLRDRCEFCTGYELGENDDPCRTCYNARTFEPDDIPRTKNWTYRGQPQDGEGKK